MTSEASRILEQIRIPALIVSARQVSFANAAAKALLGVHIQGEDVRIALRDPDAFPFSDLVVKREVKSLGAKVDLESWRPWRAYAVIYLWNRAGFMEAKK